MDNQSSSPEAHTPRQQFWLEHLEACRAQGGSLKAYSLAHDLSPGALYAAKAVARAHRSWRADVSGSTAQRRRRRNTRACRRAVLPGVARLRRRAVMIRPADNGIEVYLCVEPVDFRRQINGLATLVQDTLAMNPFSARLFGFTNRRRNQCRLLVWERNGFLLWTKRLEKERFAWPNRSDTVVTLTVAELNLLLDGYDIWRMQPHPTLAYASMY